MEAGHDDNIYVLSGRAGERASGRAGERDEHDDNIYILSGRGQIALSSAPGPRFSPEHECFLLGSPFRKNQTERMEKGGVGTATTETDRGGGPPGRADGLDGLLWEQRTEHKAECDAPSQCGRRGVRGNP